MAEQDDDMTAGETSTGHGVNGNLRPGQGAAKGAGKRATTGQRLDRAQREYDMFIRGYTLREIAAVTDVSHVTVKKDVKWITDKIRLPEREEWVKQSIDQLRVAMRRLMVEIDEERNIARNSEVLGKLQERLARMLGVDAPDAQNVDHTVTVTDPAILSMLDRARTDVAEREQKMREE